MSLEALLVAATLLLAFANGANDNPKGVATLWGTHALSYRGALALATGSTALGSLGSLLFSGALVRVFTGKGLVPDSALDASFGIAVTSGATFAVLLATRLGAPVSTTHALLGGFLGAGLLAAGGDLRLDTLAGSFALPLVLGPVLASVLAIALSRVPLGGGGPARAIRSPAFRDAGHLLSAALVGFARGVNDTPKIVGLVAGLGGVPLLVGVAAVTAAMAAGGLLAARRVAETLAHRLTPMTPAEGLAGNLATSLLVVGASQLGLPVSTTHVATGGIVGLGLARGSIVRRVLWQVAAAWLVTLPLAALASALALAWIR